MEFALCAGDFRAALVEHAGKDDVAAEADARAARSALGEVWCVHVGFRKGL